MSIVEFRGGPITHRYLMNKSKHWLASEVMTLFRIMEGSKPIPMVLHCPRCGLQHIDAPAEGWDNPPHRSHLCHGCGAIWRPADVPTNGVAEISTAGEADSWRADGKFSECGEIVQLIDELRKLEGDEVQIPCDNPGDLDWSYRNLITCNGGWTDYCDRPFTGQSLLECLRAAREAMRIADETFLASESAE